MIAQVKRHQSLSNGTVNLQHSIFLIDALILRNIDIAEVSNLLIVAAVSCFIRNFHRNGSQHLQALTQLRIVIGIHTQRFEESLDLQAPVIVELRVREDFWLQTLLVKHLMQLRLHVFYNRDEDTNLYKGIIVTHHRHGDRLEKPGLFLYGYEIRGYVAFDITLLTLSEITVARRLAPCFHAICLYTGRF